MGRGCTRPPRATRGSGLPTNNRGFPVRRFYNSPIPQETVPAQAPLLGPHSPDGRSEAGLPQGLGASYPSGGGRVSGQLRGKGGPSEESRSIPRVLLCPPHLRDTRHTEVSHGGRAGVSQAGVHVRKWAARTPALCHKLSEVKCEGPCSVLPGKTTACRAACVTGRTAPQSCFNS